MIVKTLPQLRVCLTDGTSFLVWPGKPVILHYRIKGWSAGGITVVWLGEQGNEISLPLASVERIDVVLD